MNIWIAKIHTYYYLFWFEKRQELVSLSFPAETKRKEKREKCVTSRPLGHAPTYKTIVIFPFSNQLCRFFLCFLDILKWAKNMLL